MGAVDLLTGHCPFQRKTQGRRHFLPVGQDVGPVISHIVTQVQSTWELGTAAPVPAQESVDHTPLFPGRKTAPFHTFRFCKGKISHFSHLIPSNSVLHSRKSWKELPVTFIVLFFYGFVNVKAPLPSDGSWFPGLSAGHTVCCWLPPPSRAPLWCPSDRAFRSPHPHRHPICPGSASLPG